MVIAGFIADYMIDRSLTIIDFEYAFSDAAIVKMFDSIAREHREATELSQTITRACPRAIHSVEFITKQIRSLIAIGWLRMKIECVHYYRVSSCTLRWHYLHSQTYYVVLE